MPNLNYLRGVRLERLWMLQMKRKGYNVMRAAGSKGLIDCMAWNDVEIIMAQIKNGRTAYGPKDLEKLRNMPRPDNAIVILAVRDGTVTEWEYIPCPFEKER
jgi:Holliday junction resolvase